MAIEIWTPQLLSAAFSGIAGFVGAIIGTTATWFGLDKRIQADHQLAKLKFQFDKDLLIHRRRFELAEALLADAYRFRDLLDYARNGFAFEGEGDTRKARDNETSNIKQQRNAYFAPVERLHKESEFITSFFAKQATARAHFGPEVPRAFELFSKSLQRIKVASSMLIDDCGKPGNELEFIRELEGDICAGMNRVRGRKDQISEDISEAVDLLEKLCGPALQWEGA